MANAGRQPYCMRDERGWRVPTAGTKSARVYELLRAGKWPSEIGAIIGSSSNAVRNMAWKIRRPCAANKLQREFAHTWWHFKRNNSKRDGELLQPSGENANH